MTPQSTSVGSSIAHFRRKRRLSREELARRVKRSSSCLWRIENGKAQPSVETLAALSSELKVSMERLRKGPAR